MISEDTLKKIIPQIDFAFLNTLPLAIINLFFYYHGRNS